MSTNNTEYGSPIENAEEVISGNIPGEIASDNKQSSIRFQVEEMLKEIRTGMPGIVQSSFERDTSVWLKVQPGLSSQMREELGGDEIVLPIVIAPFAGVINLNGFIINLPTPVQGDEVWITCSDRNIATFCKQGGTGIPVTNTILSLNNSFCLPFSVSNVMRKRTGEATDITITDPAGYTTIISKDGTKTINGPSDSYLSVDTDGTWDINGNFTVSV